MPSPPEALPELGDRPLEGRAALVTGGTRGLGRAMAERLARAGADVAIVSRSQPDCDRLARELSDNHRISAVGIGLDVSDLGQAEHVVARAVGGLGRLDILINNAGTGSVQPIAELDDATIARLMNLNLSAAMALSRASLQPLTRSGSGCILNVSSVLGLIGREFRTAYCASKGALIAFTRALAMELLSRNIMVNAVAPGQFYTSLTAGMWEDDAKRDSVTSLIPAGRWGHPTEMVDLLIPLFTDRGRYMTGQTIIIDGGWTL